MRAENLTREAPASSHQVTPEEMVNLEEVLLL
jgi:hypothetical protein